MGTYDGATTKIYIDGIIEASATNATGNIGANNGNLAIGRWEYTPGRYFTGQIDDVRVYNYALTAAQVRDVYNSGAVGFR